MISRKPQNLLWSWKQARQTWRHKYRIIRFQSRRGHFWFVFVKLSEIVGFSYLEHAKTNFETWYCFLLVWLMFLKRIFNKRKIVQISLHLTFTSRCFLPKTSFLDILEIFRLDMGQISSNLLKKTFATWQHGFCSTSTVFYDFAQACAEIKIFGQESDLRL